MSDVDDAILLLRSKGYSVTKPSGRGMWRQELFVCTWGTITALVWASNEEWAEKRVRHQVFTRQSSGFEVEKHPVRVSGDVLVRKATDADLVRFEEAGGKVPA